MSISRNGANIYIYIYIYRLIKTTHLRIISIITIFIFIYIILIIIIVLVEASRIKYWSYMKYNNSPLFLKLLHLFNYHKNQCK